MWIHDKIKKDLEDIYPGSIKKLNNIKSIPYEKAILLTAYLWENCFSTDNDIWVVSSRGLLWQIPNDWIETNVEKILQHIKIDWSDDFQYSNMCAVFFHIPSILKILIDIARKKVINSAVLEFVNDFEEYLPNGDMHIYQKTMELFESSKGLLID
ncbi:hypothetical protein [Clostridium drakei]|uniref:hypothetical protein n=1 Tax=Clostridium drakei TaxID=332101 RepID=UPI000A82F9AC|nr:hypothetical protein [Clostridium drakei]